MSKTPTIKSADDLILQEEAKKLGNPIPEIVQEKVEEAVEPVEEVVEEKVEEPVVEETKDEEVKAETLEDDVDDYGTKRTKAKLYTEEEVQNMIRDRLKRGHHVDQTPEVQEATKNFEADPTSSEPWEAQLETFIESTLTKLAHKQEQTIHRQKEEQTRAEFEIKFTNGMNKYADFKNVVTGKPITDSMMLAARSTQDPAAFIYSACKQHPAEVERISKIPDAVAQIAEMGRLEERMKKGRAVTKAPPPASKARGDMSDDMPKESVDSMIARYAKDKFMRHK